MNLSYNDPWLKPYEGRIQKRNEYMSIREKELTQGGELSLSDFADDIYTMVYIELQKEIGL